jgi:DNA-binding transcriptional MerR regulator
MAEHGGLLPIGRFARSTGLSVPQLRHYDRLGILVPAVRDPESGYRFYRHEQVAAARVIALLRSIDMPLADVEELLASPDPGRIRRVFAEHRSRVERRLGAARTALESIDAIIEEGRLMPESNDEQCSFCRRVQADRPIVLTAGDVRICRACVDLCREVIDLEVQRRRDGGAPPPPTAELNPAADSMPTACSFCGRDKAEVQFLVAGPGTLICDGCVAGAVA